MQPTGAEPLRPHDPAVIGPYRLLGRLGEGGMGTVYLAVAPTGRLVAVKVVKAEFTVDDDFAARFHGEVDNARKVASFCTAQVLDNGNSATGAPYMVTEYIAGTPLSRQISQYGALDPGPLHGVALGVAAALAAIHVAGLVHRDLKPANVILSISGPRVIDFGIARALDATHGFTQSGELLGSPGWWAPEQVRGEEITPATDIFAWGCLVAYAGNGRHPYGRGDAVTLAARVLNTGPDLGALPAPLNELAQRATHPDPYRRPSAQDLLIALVGGAIPETPQIPEAPLQSRTQTLIATEMLSESWEPPANVAEESDSTQTLARTAVAPVEPFAPPEPVTPPQPVEPEPVVVVNAGDGPTGPVRTEETDPRAFIPSQREAEPTAPQAFAPSGPQAFAPSGPQAFAPSGPQAEPGERRSSKTRWILASAAVVAALTVTGGILFIANQGDKPRGTGTVAVKTPDVVVGPDVGRRISLAAADIQLLVPQQPRCGVPSYQGATAKQGGFCLVRWTMLNPGGEPAAIGTEAPRLVDDRGSSYEPGKNSTALPSALTPGGKVDGVLVFDVPAGRKPAKLLLANDVEVRL